MRVRLIPPDSPLAGVLAVGEPAEVAVLDGGQSTTELPSVLVIPSAPAVLAAAPAFVDVPADAFVVGTHQLDVAIAWVHREDRAARTTGVPRLVSICALHDDYGIATALPPDRPLALGRSLQNAIHPRRPDAIFTASGTVARNHARVQWWPQQRRLAMRDLVSTNGTLLIRRGEPARLVTATTYQHELPPWIVAERTDDWVELRIGDELVLPGFWRFRVDGDLEHPTAD